MPDWKAEIRARLAGVNLEGAREAAIVEELAQHLDDRFEELRSRGATESEARRQALEELSGEDLLARELRKVETSERPQLSMPGEAKGNMIENILADLKFGVRQLVKNPGFACVAVLTLALGIGANAIIFTLISAVMFKPVMARRPDQLVTLYQQNLEGKSPGEWQHFTYNDFADLKADKSVFADLAAEDTDLVGVRDHGLNEMVPVHLVSANYFSVLGVAPVLGRGIQPEEETSAAPVAVLTHAFWERLGSDPSIIGQTLKLSRGFATIVGVMPRGFTGARLAAPGFFLSLGAEDALNTQAGQPPPHILADRTRGHFSITGRLREGLKLKMAAGALSGLNRRFPLFDPGDAQERKLLCTPLVRFDDHPRPEQLEREAVPFGLLAQGMTLLILFIACLNLANMMLARGAARQKEIAVRMAVGAARGRILGQLLTEGLLLAFLGGAAGVMVAIWAAQLLGMIVAGRLGIELPSRGSWMDWRLIAAMAGFSALATLFFALVPAWRLSRLDFNSDLKRSPETDSSGSGRGLLRMKHLIASGQLALVATMLIAAGLFTRSAIRAAGASPGFDFGSNFFIRLDERSSRDTEAQATQLLREAGERIAALPGVESVSPARLIPFGPASSGCRVWPGPTPPAPEDPLVSATYNIVGMNYFHTLGIPLLRGREFNREEVESAGAPPAVIVNEALAARSWPGKDPIGQILQMPVANGGASWRSATVIGVIPDLAWDILDQRGSAWVCEPPAGHFLSAWNLHVRVAKGVSVAKLMATCSEALSGLADRIPLPQLHTLKEMQKMSPKILLMEVGGGLFAVLGSVAILLSCLGIYGLKAYEVTRRTREIGIRIALGATSGNVLGIILREGAGLALLGLGLGLPLSLAAGWVATRFLYQTKPYDPLIFISMPLLLLGVILLACWAPARRAAKLDPMVALRCE